MMWGIELDRPAKDVARALLARGFVVGTARDNVIRLLPPFITPKKAFVEFLAALEEQLLVAGCQLPATELPVRQPRTGNRQPITQGAIAK